MLLVLAILPRLLIWSIIFSLIWEAVNAGCLVSGKYPGLGSSLEKVLGFFDLLSSFVKLVHEAFMFSLCRREVFHCKQNTEY